ncbi:MAG TPA: GGDEF domain-containing protein [Longimicrobiales bacterium]|nr:GGDEF domain-containing protein [Longimicrobiales bacterium]
MSLKTLFTLIAPGAVTLTAAGMLLVFMPTADVLGQASRGYPLVALAVAVLLAWRMHRSRVLLTALLLLAAQGVLHERTFGDHLAVTTLTATLLPVLVAVLALSTDRNVAGRHVAVQTLLLVMTAGGATAALIAAPAETRYFLTYPFIDPIYTSWTGLEQVALAAALTGLGTLAAIALFREKATDAGLGWAALAGVLAMAQPAGTTGRGIWMLAAGLVLIITLVEASYMMAFHDELTGLPARRVLSQTLSALRPPYTVAIVDVDHFKSFNDRYGHDVGDEVLRMVASRLAAVTGGGRAYRSGGEEFTIVFPGRTKAEALPHVEEVREAVAGAKFTLRRQPRPTKAEGERRRGTRRSDERRIGVTISVGLAGVDGRNPTTDAVVKAADKAMYRAKKNGRNRVVA